MSETLYLGIMPKQILDYTLMKWNILWWSIWRPCKVSFVQDNLLYFYIFTNLIYATKKTTITLFIIYSLVVHKRMYPSFTSPTFSNMSWWKSKNSTLRNFNQLQNLKIPCSVLNYLQGELYLYCSLTCK